MAELIKRIATAWLHHQGYTDMQIDAIPDGEIDIHTHERLYGCSFSNWTLTWDCEDEHGNSNHPVLDAVTEASEMANVIVEALGLTQEFAGCVEDENGDPQLIARDRWLTVDSARDDTDRLPTPYGAFVGAAWLTRWERTDGS